MMTTLGGHEGN